MPKRYPFRNFFRFTFSPKRKQWKSVLISLYRMISVYLDVYLEKIQETGKIETFEISNDLDPLILTFAN